MASSSAIAARPVASSSASAASSTLVVIDPNVSDYQMLASGVLPGVSLVVLEGDRDGVEQITEILKQRSDITNLHIVSHGSPGCLHLGNTQLSLETIDRYAWELQSWFSSTHSHYALSLFACNVAAEEVGAEFLTKLHQLTEAAIAASTQPLGQGNWNLDVAVGTTASLSPTPALEPAVLATYTAQLANTAPTSGVLQNTTFTFEYPYNGNSFTEDGYVFQGFEDYPSDYGVNNSGMTYTYAWNDSAADGADGAIYRADGQNFSLQSFSAASFMDTTLTVLGFDNGIQVASRSITYATTHQTFTFDSSWSNIDEVRFDVLSSNNDYYYNEYLLLDDLVVGNYVDDLSGAVTEQGTPSGNLTDSGTISFSDVDVADVHLVSPTGTPIGSVVGSLTAVKDSDTTGTGTGGQLTWTYSVDAAAVEYLAAGQTKVESFTIDIDDQNGGILTKQIDVTITGTNDAPTGAATATLTTGTEDTVYTISATELLQGFSDVDATDTLSVSALTATNGTLVNNGNGTYSFTPTANYNGTVNLSYNVIDGNGGSVAATQSFSLAAVNDAPSSATFKIASLSATGANAIEHSFVTGDDRGGIAISSSQVFYTGDSSTGRFSKVDLSGGSSVGQQYDAIFSNLATGDVFTFGNGSTPLPNGGGTITELIGIDGNSGNLTSTRITLSASIATSGMTGIFSGFNRTAIYTNGQVYNIDLPSGTVTNLGAMSEPSMFYTESWARWGVAEYFDNALYLTYASNNNYSTIERMRVPSGETETVATFSNLSDMASFTVSPADNRWYFHYEGSGQFRSGDETIGYADASFLFSSSGGANLSGGVTELDTPIGSLTDSGTLTFVDPDLADVHVVSPTGTPIGSVLGSLTAVKDSDTTGTGTGGQLTWTYSVDTAAVEYLAAGQTKVESFTITIDDQNSGILTKQIDVTITGTNDAPTGAATATLTAGTEDTVYTINATDLLQGFSDVDATDTLSVSALTATNGMLVNNNDGTYSFTPTANYNGTVNLSYNVIDSNSGSVAATQSFSLAAVNDAPSLNANATLPAVIEDSSNPTGQAIASLFATAFNDLDAGSSFGGIAIVGNSANAVTEGTWQYSTDNGTNWYDVGMVADDATALAVSSSTLVRFVSVADYTGIPANLTVRTIDDTYAGSFTDGATRQTVDTSVNGGITAIAATTNTIGTSITPVADPAVIGGVTTGSVTEDGILTANGTLTITDADAGEATFVTQNGVTGIYGSFNIDAAGVWSYTADNTKLQPLKGGESVTDSFDIASSDGTTKTITIAANGVNDTPTVMGAIADQIANVRQPFTLTLPVNTFADQDAGDTLTLSATLADGGPLPTWITFDANSHSFSGTPDFMDAGNLSLKVMATDSQGGTTSDILIVMVEQFTGEVGTPTLPIVFSQTPSGVTYTGTSKVDQLFGTWMNDVLKGGGGNDILKSGFAKGLFGQDKLYGEGGNDRLYGGRGNDLLDGGQGNDRLKGGKGRDLLKGGDGDDRLLGGKDDDILIGGNGNDMLIGNQGRDIFVFENLTDGVDTITDFSDEDLIDLRSLMAQPQFAAVSAFAKFTQFIQLQQLGADTQIQIDSDGIGAGTATTTLAVLRNVAVSSVASTHFLIGS